MTLLTSDLYDVVSRGKYEALLIRMACSLNTVLKRN